MDITLILQAVIYLLVAIAMVIVIPLLRKQVGAENMDELMRWVEIGVAAAEQLYTAAQGAQKKQYVLEFVRSKGLKIDEASLDATIEAAVNALHNELYGGGKNAVQS